MLGIQGEKGGCAIAFLRRRHVGMEAEGCYASYRWGVLGALCCHCRVKEGVGEDGDGEGEGKPHLGGERKWTCGALDVNEKASSIQRVID